MDRKLTVEKMEDCRTQDFGPAVMEQMYQFYKEDQFCDFEITVESTVYKIHRLVFASTSDYFRAMLSHDMVETRKDHTELKGVSKKGFEPLIRYIYTGTLTLSLDNIQEVISAATFLQIKMAIDLCISYLKEKMTFENAEELLNIGEIFSIPSLKEYYRNYILKNFLQFVESSSFLKIDAESLTDYLSDDALITTSESVLLHHCLRWYEYDKVTRESLAYDVFDKIRLVVDGWPIIDFARTQEPFLSNPKCKELVTFAEKYLEQAERRYLTSTHRTRVRYTRKTLVQFGGLMQANPSYDFDDFMSLPDDQLVGWTQNHHFHPDLKAWFGLGCLSVGERRSHAKVVEVNDFGILTGGYEYFIDDDETVLRTCVKDVKMFSAQGHFSLWDMNGLQHARAHHAACHLQGCIYVIGGKDDRQSLSSVEKLDCDKEIWTYMKPLPKVLYDHAATVCNDKIYVSGGVERFDVKNNVWCYDPAKNKWNKRAPLIQARAGHGMIANGKFLYVAGGYHSTPLSSERCLPTFERYSLDSNQWTSLTSMKQSIAHFEMILYNEKILVLGGVDTGGQLTQYIHEYDLSLDRWKVFGELPRPLKNLTCCAITVKLTDTGSGEDETDSVLEGFKSYMDEEDGFMAVIDDSQDELDFFLG